MLKGWISAIGWMAIIYTFLRGLSCVLFCENPGRYDTGVGSMKALTRANFGGF